MRFKAGDTLHVTSRGIPLVKHIGIITLDSFMPYVWHNTPGMVNDSGGSVIREPLERFLTGRELIQLTGTGLDSDTIESRAVRLLDKPFDLFSFNCEHFVNSVVTGRAVSPQLNHWLLLAVVLFLIENKKH